MNVIYRIMLRQIKLNSFSINIHFVDWSLIPSSLCTNSNASPILLTRAEPNEMQLCRIFRRILAQTMLAERIFTTLTNKFTNNYITTDTELSYTSIYMHMFEHIENTRCQCHQTDASFQPLVLIKIIAESYITRGIIM